MPESRKAGHDIAGSTAVSLNDSSTRLLTKEAGTVSPMTRSVPAPANPSGTVSSSSSLYTVSPPSCPPPSLPPAIRVRQSLASSYQVCSTRANVMRCRPLNTHDATTFLTGSTSARSSLHHASTYVFEFHITCVDGSILCVRVFVCVCVRERDYVDKCICGCDAGLARPMPAPLFMDQCYVCVCACMCVYLCVCVNVNVYVYAYFGVYLYVYIYKANVHMNINI